MEHDRRGGILRRWQAVDGCPCKARRRVVEACRSWPDNFRKLKIRHEKLTAGCLALLHLAFAIIALRKENSKIIYG